MFRNACTTASILKHNMYLIGDRLFLSRAGLVILNEFNKTSTSSIHFVTRCRCNVTAYELPPKREPHAHGAPRKKGETLKLGEQFDNSKYEWSTETITMYGIDQKVTYAVVDRLWGKGLYQLVRFVLVKYSTKRTILVSTDLTLSGKQIIELYCIRARIESSFREYKQIIGGFSYHFWTKAMPKLNHFRKSTDPDPLSLVSNWNDRLRIARAVRATEMYTLISCVTMGIIHMISVKFEFSEDDFRWQRTSVNTERPSEANIQEYLQRTIRPCLLDSDQTKLSRKLAEFFDEADFMQLKEVLNADSSAA